MTTQAPVDVRAAGPLATEPTTATVMQSAGGLMAVKHLSPASELGLCEPWPAAQRLWDARAARTGLTRCLHRLSSNERCHF
jgi:hypothetical protein